MALDLATCACGEVLKGEEAVGLRPVHRHQLGIQDCCLCDTCAPCCIVTPSRFLLR